MNQAQIALGSSAVLLAVLTGTAHLERNRLEAELAASISTREARDEAQGIGWSHKPSRHVSTDGRIVRIGATASDTHLQFFLPNCPACRLEAPGWNAVAEECASEGVQFVAVAASSDGLKQFFEEFPCSYPVLSEDAGALVAEFGIESYPERVLVDRFGRVSARDSVLVTLSSQGGSWESVAAEWPDAARDSILETLVRSVLPDARKLLEIPLREGGPNRIVCEGETGVLGFGAILSRRTYRAECSSLDCLVILDGSGTALAVLPLAQHSVLGRPVGRSELEQWVQPPPLDKSTSWLQRAFTSELRTLRADCGFDRGIPRPSIASDSRRF